METTLSFKDHTIALNDDMRFTVTGPMYTDARPRDCIFDAVADARADITKRLDEQVRENAKNVRLALAVITDLGSKALVTKINRTNGHVDVEAHRYMYPAVPWLIEAVRRYREVAAELDALETKIKPFRLNASRTWSGGRISIDEFPNAVAHLTTEYNTKRDEALALVAPPADEPAPISE